jgi:hypothetical protein
MPAILAELPGVDVDQLAGPLALEALEAAEAEAPQDAADGRDRQAEAAGDHG